MCLLFALTIAVTALPTAANNVKLTWFINRSPAELVFWQEMADRFQQQNPGIEVEIINGTDQGGLNKLATMIAAGTPPDVVRGETDWMPDYAAQGLFLDLREYIARDMAELALEEFPQPALSAFQYGSMQYALPVVLSALVYNYNIAMYDEAGLPYPDPNWTWSDYLEISKRLTRVDSEGEVVQYGASLPRNIGNRAVVFLWQNGGDLYDPDMTEILIDRPESIEALDFLRSLIHEHGVVSSPSVERVIGGDQQQFISGLTASQITGPWRRGAHNVLDGLDWDIAPLPRNANDATVILAGGMAVVAGTRHPDEAWEFVKYLTGTEAQHIWATNGQSSPARIPVALSDSFLYAGAPQNSRYYIDVIASGRPEPSFPGWPQINSSINQALAPMWEGARDAFTAARQAKEIAQALLDETRNNR